MQSLTTTDHDSSVLCFTSHDSYSRGLLGVPAVAALAATATRSIMSSSSPPRANDGASCVVSRDAVFTVAVHPSALRDPLRGARAVLDAAAMRHCDALGGVLMSYADARLAGHAGRRTSDSDSASASASDSEASEASTSDEESAIGFGRVLHASGHVDVCVRARCEVFMPVRGSRLVGVVNKVAHDFIGALVLDTFNVAIAAENIREELVSSVDETGCWKSAWDDEHVIRVGSQIVFTVKNVTESDNVVLLSGEMRDQATGERGYVARSSSGLTSIERKLVADTREKKEKKEKKGKKEKKEKREKREKKEKKEKKRERASGEDETAKSKRRKE